MFKIKVLVLIALLFALTTGVAYSNVSKVKICERIGFFQHFLKQNLKMTGCDDANDKVRLEVAPTGLVLRKLSGNGDIPIKVVSDTKGTATGVNQFGEPDHDGTFKVNQDEIEVTFTNQSGGSCNGTLRADAYCRYSVTASTCLLDIPLGSNVCAPCGKPCIDYGNSFITVFAQGVKGTCDLKLKRVFTNCVTCVAGTGIVISPQDE